MIVVDASALVEVLLRTPVAAQIEKHMFVAGQTLHAPQLLDIEVAHVIRRFAASGEISGERGRCALVDLADLPVQRYPHTILLPRIWSLRSSISAYDAAYVALAEALDAHLITRDRRLAAATGHNATVELV